MQPVGPVKPVEQVPHISKAMSLEVLCWNLHAAFLASHTAQRLERAAERILEEQPDVALLQELWKHDDAKNMVNRLAEAYASADIAGHGFFARRSGLLTFVRNQGGWSVRGTSFREFEAVGSAWWKLREGDAFAGKGVQRVDIERQGARVVLLNTHLQAEYGEGERSRYLEVRRKQLEELRAFAERVPIDLPLIAAGDLNTRPAEEPYARLIEYWNDLGEHRRSACQCGTHFLDSGREGAWIDYILARRRGAWDIQATRFDRILNASSDEPYSDHHGLIATLALARRASATLTLLAVSPALLNLGLTRRQCLRALSLGLVPGRAG